MVWSRPTWLHHRLAQLLLVVARVWVCGLGCAGLPGRSACLLELKTQDRIYRLSVAGVMPSLKFTQIEEERLGHQTAFAVTRWGLAGRERKGNVL